tara:strand:+ start:413 stop:547 length:135 start_codon:yes stop_codon:yes gene_type:complete
MAEDLKYGDKKIIKEKINKIFSFNLNLSLRIKKKIKGKKLHKKI